MGIYFIGILIVIVSLLLFIYNRSWFFYLTIFFIPFSSTAVFKIGDNSVSLPFVFVTINFIYYSLSIIFRLSIKFKKESRWVYFYLGLIFIIVTFSGLMPFYINGNLLVLDKYSDLLTYANLIPLQPKVQYVTQLMYLQVGIWFTFYLTEEIDTIEKWKAVVKCLVLSCLFISLWGLFEFSTFYLGIEYPAYLFSNLGLNSNGVNILNNMPRISSVTLEPSVFAQTFSFVIPLFGWLRYEGYTFFSRRGDFYLLILFLVTLALSNSSTAYLVLFFLLLQYFWKTIFSRTKTIYKFLFFVSFVIIIGILIPYLIVYSLNKLTDYSGQERTLALISGFGYFIEYPVLGIGWGVFHVWDFFVCIACGAGVIGLIAVLLLINKINSKLNKIKKHFLNHATSVSYASISLLLANEISGFLYYTQFIWLYLGIILSYLVIKERKINEESKNIGNNSHI